MELHAIILAAGRGTRMQSQRPKVLHEVAGRPMLAHVLQAAREGGAQTLHVVHGHGGAAVRARFPEDDLRWAEQAEPLGTAHAVAQALPAVPDDTVVVVLYGDVPLVPSAAVRQLAERGAQGLALSTAMLDDPHGYGRILRDAGGRVIGIVEENDASAEQKRIREINTGLLAAPARRLKAWVARVGNDNAKGEFYLPDVVRLAVAEGVEVQTVPADAAADFEGVNDRVQLARAERRCQRRAAEQLMRRGVTLIDPARFDLRGELRCGEDVVIDVGVVIEGRVVLGDRVRVGAYSALRDVELGADCEVLSHCVLEGLKAESGCRLGPFTRVRPGTVLAADVHLGNFVEIKKSTLGRRSKAGHLAYVGDATVGRDVNLSAGVITCNYDGANKHTTVIGDGAFIGTDSQLVAPVTIGRNAFIGAGSTITRDAPPDALTLCRPREQHSKPGWPRPKKA